MYRQYDGYPSGHGKELHAFLSDLALCNGLGGKPPRGKVWANGASCLAAPMVGGMLSAPLLSLFVVPAAYLLMRRRSA